MRFTDELPIYIQISNLLKSQIIKGEYKIGDKLLSVRDMASKLTVNPNTVQRAYQELEQEGIVETKRGMGTFVIEDERKINELRENMALEIIEKFLEDIKLLGLTKEEIIKLIEEVENSNKI